MRIIFVLLALFCIAIHAKVTTYKTCIRDLEGLRAYSTLECKHSVLGDRVVCFNFRKTYVCTNEGTGDYRWALLQ